MTSLISFLVFLGFFFLIGISSAFKSQGTKADYYLAGQSLGPLACGLSAVATNNSGYMFIGVIGYTYQTGLASIWLLIGWILGDFLASSFIHKKLQVATTQTGEVSFCGVIAKWSAGEMPYWRAIAGILTLVFLGAYAAAQISASSKALNGILGWDKTTGAWIAAVIILLYSIAGGIRASVWTDVAQSFVMILAMGILVLFGFSALGGIDKVMQAWQAIPQYFALFPSNLPVPGLLGWILFVLGWLAAGLSVIGQPHIMVRFMALDSVHSFRAARIYYYVFFVLFYLLATMAGMLSRVYFPDLGNLDPEMALPTMAVKLLDPVLVGLFLAGVFAATMSTADSLILSCSSVITHDLLPKRFESQRVIKLNTALVTFIALLIALYGSSSVFDLVIMSWAVMAAIFAPILILLVMRRVLTESVAIVILLLGISTALFWRHFDLNQITYEGLPSILVALSAGYFLSKK